MARFRIRIIFIRHPGEKGVEDGEGQRNGSEEGRSRAEGLREGGVRGAARGHCF